MNITGSLWIREGIVLATFGSSIITSPGPSHNIRLGDTGGTASTYFAIPSGATCYADFIVESGSSGTRSIATARTYNGGKYVGDFTLNADLTMPAAYPCWLSGNWSGSGGVTKTSATYPAGFTGHLSYSGATTVSAGKVVIAGTTANLGDIVVNGNGSFNCGVTLNLASGKKLDVDTGTLYIGNPTRAGNYRSATDVRGKLTLNGDLLLRAGATATFQLGATGTPGTSTTYDAIAIDGDLTLDGALNVLQLTGYDGTTGVYEIMTYTGTLTDNGMTVTNVDEPYWLDTTSESGKVMLRTGVSAPAAPSGTIILIK